MQIKNLRIVLSFISLAVTVLSAPIDYENIEASPIPVPSNVKINEKIINGGGNPFIEASPITIPFNRNIKGKILKDKRIPMKGMIEASPIPVSSNRKINEKILNGGQGKNPFIEASPIPVPFTGNINELLNGEQGKNPFIEASPIPVPFTGNINEELLNGGDNSNNDNTKYEHSYPPLPGYEEFIIEDHKRKEEAQNGEQKVNEEIPTQVNNIAVPYPTDVPVPVYPVPAPIPPSPAPVPPIPQPPTPCSSAPVPPAIPQPVIDGEASPVLVPGNKVIDEKTNNGERTPTEVNTVIIPHQVTSGPVSCFPTVLPQSDPQPIIPHPVPQPLPPQPIVPDEPISPLPIPTQPNPQPIPQPIPITFPNDENINEDIEEVTENADIEFEHSYPPLPGYEEFIIEDHKRKEEARKEKEKNMIEASPIPVPSNEDIDERIINDEEVTENAEEVTESADIEFEHSYPPLPGYKEFIIEDHERKEESRKEKEDLIKASPIPVPIEGDDIFNLNIPNPFAGLSDQPSTIDIPVRKEDADLFNTY